MARIRFEGAQKDFGNVQVVKNLSLIIEDGQFFTFVGPSGCGKSTILNMIAGLEEITDGVLYFDDIAVNSLSPTERDVAMVFQSYALYPHMTVYENIAFPLKMKKIAKDLADREIRRIASLLGLEDLLSRKPKQLSGGQRQRVALGRAIVRRPKIFLLDEPLSNLDARLRVEMRAELKKLHNELKITTVYVTHDQAEALSLSDVLAVFNGGEIQQCGTPQEIYRNPANMFVAGFIGSPPMNFIPCTVINDDPAKIECMGVLLELGIDKIRRGCKVIAGIRPEDITVSYNKGTSGVPVNVQIVEHAGSYDWIEVDREGTVVRGSGKDGEAFVFGQAAWLDFARNKVILFDGETGERLI